MSLLSAQTLFHYTKKAYLLDVLENGFVPRYSKEFDIDKGENLTFGHHLYIPMVCFCDTPLSLVEKHMDIYGPCGIGLSKDWGIRNGLNPVFYINKGSTVHENLIVPIQNLCTKDAEIKDEYLSSIVRDLVFIYRYMKPYEPARGTYERNGRKYCDYLYYDEKEWRYVPINLETDQKVSFESTNLEIKTANDNLARRPLKFDVRDINFIIIEKESDTDAIINSFRNSKNFVNKEKVDEQYLLTTLITAESIRKNF